MGYELGRCRLRDIRREVKWTQRKLSEYTGLSTDVLSKYENNVNTVTYYNAIVITETIRDKTGVEINPRDLYDIVRT